MFQLEGQFEQGTKKGNSLLSSKSVVQGFECPSLGDPNDIFPPVLNIVNSTALCISAQRPGGGAGGGGKDLVTWCPSA